MIETVSATRTRPVKLTCLFAGWKLLDSTKLPQHPENEAPTIADPLTTEPLIQIQVNNFVTTPTLTTSPKPTPKPEPEPVKTVKAEPILEPYHSQNNDIFNMDYCDESSFELPCLCDNFDCDECNAYTKSIENTWESNPLSSSMLTDEPPFPQRVNMSLHQLVVW